MTQVVVIGAGPYGLSVGAHLRHLRVPFRVFGKTMSMWQDHMPKGLTLKSDAFASNLAAPEDGYPLEQFYREAGRTDYSHIGLRVPASTLIDYGHEFQRRCVGEVDEARVIELTKAGNGFNLELDTGEQISARKVILATGLLSLSHIPESFSSLPSTMVSHCSAHHELAKFSGRRVIVVGGGQSACETSALLNEQGAEVTMLTRRPLLWFKPENEDRPHVQPSAWRRVRRPNFGLGPGWRVWFHSEMPSAFTYLPQSMRHTQAYSAFGPAGSGWIKHRVDGVIPIHTGSLRSARAHGGEALLSVDTTEGLVSLAADHVIAATGYRADVRRLSFLDRMQGDILSIGGVPVLNRAFESSAPGLHFIGYMSAATFGPSMRFIYGTRFAARRVSRHLSYLGDGKQRAERLSARQPAQAGASM